MQKFIRLVVESLEKIAFVGMVFFMLAGLVSGYGAGGFFGMIIGVFMAFIFGTLTFGALFLLIENNRNLREIRWLLGEKP